MQKPPQFKNEANKLRRNLFLFYKHKLLGFSIFNQKKEGLKRIFCVLETSVA